MKILSCNIRCFGGADGENSWPHRRDLAIDVIRAHSPDIICFQEMWSQQFDDCRSAFVDFETFATVDEPVGLHPMNAIFFRGDSFVRLSAGGYWLSESPHVPGSKSWDSDCVRLANWLRLVDNRMGREFRVINTHLDHVGQIARERQASLLVDDTTAYPDDYPQILTGDLNCTATNRAVRILKAGGWKDTYGAIHGTENPGNTYHGFLGPYFAYEVGKIDWIFFKGRLDVLEAEVITDARNGKFPSDHYFVSAVLDWA